jgi:glycolate oxidase
MPAHKETFLITSKSLQKTTELVTELLNASISPCTLEYMDRTAIKVVSEFMESPPPKGTEALLIVEIDGEKEIVSERVTRLLNLVKGLEEFSITHAQSKNDIDKIWQARRAISPSVFKLKPNKIGEDVAVPRSRIPELVAFCEKLSLELELIILTFGHAGDGNIHVNIMLDRSNPEEVERANQAKSQLFKQAIALDGTLSGEHGIGFSKAPFMPLELNPATLSVMKQIKTLFDPKNILNPGKIFPN